MPTLGDLRLSWHRAVRSLAQALGCVPGQPPMTGRDGTPHVVDRELTRC